jgi:TnpA family transposase
MNLRTSAVTTPICNKNEQVHQLARDITYGNRGRFKGKSLEDINSSGNCTALIIAAITYW